MKNISGIIMILEKDKGLNKMWQDYKEKHQYSKKVKYLDVINSLKIIENHINL